MECLITVPEPSFPSLFTSIPYGQMQAESKFLVIDESDYKRMFRLAPFDKEYFLSSILLMNIEKLGRLKVENYRELYYRSLRKRGQATVSDFITLLKKNEEELLHLAMHVWESWTEYARNDVRETILKKVDSESLKFFETSKKAACNTLKCIWQGKIDDTIEGTIQKVISKTVASYFISQRYAEKYGLRYVSITDSEEYKHVANSLLNLMTGNRDSIKNGSLTPDTFLKRFRCFNSNFIRIHQRIFSLLSRLAPDIGINTNLMPPYFVGTSIGYLFDFNLEDVINDLESYRPDKIKEDTKKILRKLDNRQFIIKNTPKMSYLAEYVVEEMPNPVPKLVKPIQHVLKDWLRQNSLEYQIDKLRADYYDGIVFAALSFWSDPFYQVDKHKIFYYLWKWYRKVFDRPKKDDMKWYTTQRTFEKWTKAKRWYEKS